MDTEVFGQSQPLGLRSPNESDAMVETLGVPRPSTIGNYDLMFDGLMEIFTWNSYR